MTTVQIFAPGAGTQTAGLAMGGMTGPCFRCIQKNIMELLGQQVEIYLWELQEGRAAGAGTQTAALIIGGTDGPPAGLGATEEYDGATWTAGGIL
jgi:hypothetical protein